MTNFRSIGLLYLPLSLAGARLSCCRDYRRKRAEGRLQPGANRCNSTTPRKGRDRLLYFASPCRRGRQPTSHHGSLPFSRPTRQKMNMVQLRFVLSLSDHVCLFVAGPGVKDIIGRGGGTGAQRGRSPPPPPKKKICGGATPPENQAETPVYLFS